MATEYVDSPRFELKTTNRLPTSKQTPIISYGVDSQRFTLGIVGKLPSSIKSGSPSNVQPSAFYWH